MSSLTSELFGEFIRNLPNDEFELNKVNEYLSLYVPKLVNASGLCFFKTILVSPSNISRPKVLDLEDVLHEYRYGELGETKEIIFNVGSGGYIKNIAAVHAGEEWNTDLENDFYVISKTIYLIYGRAKAMKYLNRHVFHDSLTGVANETQLTRFMESKLEAGVFTDYCTSFINIKSMKLFNGNYGSRVGNQVLIKFARKIELFLGDAGCIARLGGDNFAVFSKKSLQTDFIEFLKDICIDLDLNDGKVVTVKVESRIGFCFMQPGETISDAMNNSSIALNCARKSCGTDVVLYEENMKIRMLSVKQLERNVPDALRKEEFIVYYQPKASIRDVTKYTIDGAEALVRWIRDGKMVMPGDFVPILEENGMITQVDFYVLERVCQDIKEWEKRGIAPVKISSNFSRRHLRNPHFADRIEEIIKQYDVDPSYIEIEITESYEAEDMEALSLFEGKMHDLGISLAVDDFGSGFSSLKMLKNISSDTIKLDKSIIDGIGGEQKDDEIIVGHVIHMVVELGKKVIAEGVEHKAQADFLRRSGCPSIQGYLYAKPMPKDEFEKMLIEDV